MRFIILLLFGVLSFSIELQKPKVYNEENVTGWYMSEKLDGIRAYWNGKELLTRKGKKIFAPKWFIKDFPNFQLDGELWTKRDDFEKIQNIVMDKNPSDDWKLITYNIFETPNSEGDFLERLKKAEKWIEKKSLSHVKIIKQIKIKDENHLNKFLEKIITLKGEGVIVKDSSQPYHTGRSSHVLKVKKAQDMEGVVIDINLNEKTKLLKSLVIKLENGVIFNLGNGFSKKQREIYPKIGDIITFKYYGFTKYKKPKFASFLYIRKD